MSSPTRDISQAFVAARKAGRAIGAFPGAQPLTLADAYSVQEDELRVGGPFAGWKVAAIKPELRDSLGAARLAGPIVRVADATTSGDAAIEVPVIEGGFAAVEAEFAIRIGRDIRLYGQDRSEADLLLSIAALHVASEIAGSPLPTLSDLGPTAVISDHGNNAAVVIGPEIANWRGRSWETLTARTFVNGTLVGEGGASRLPTGGILGSLAFLVNNLAERGRYLKAGDWVATGATTGVHKVAPGDEAAIDFGSDGTLRLKIAAQKKD